MISFRDITVVIQGAVHETVTQEVISSVRRHLPQAYIIFSTCDNEVPDTLQGYDHLLLSPDPGSYVYPHRPEQRPNNVNRQIINTHAALQKVTTPFVMKLRSDFILTGNSFLDYFERYSAVEEEYRVFGHKILACCYFTRHMHKGLPYPFHLSDLIYFGRTEDVQKLYDVPLMSREEAYWDKKDMYQYRYTPEQHIFINCLRKNGFVANCNSYKDCTLENISQTERYYATNFILLNFEQFNVCCHKTTFQKREHPKDFLYCYTHFDWLHLYNFYMKANFSLPDKDMEREELKKMYRAYKKYNFIANILAFPLFYSKKHRRRLRNWVRRFLFSITK